LTHDAVLDLADIADALNVLAARGGNPQRWNRKKVYRLLKAGGANLIQREPGCKYYVTQTELRRAFPQFWEALLDAQSLAEDGDGDHP